MPLEKIRLGGLSLRKKIGPNGPFGDPGGPFLSTGSLIFKKKTF